MNLECVIDCGRLIQDEWVFAHDLLHESLLLLVLFLKFLHIVRRLLLSKSLEQELVLHGDLDQLSPSAVPIQALAEYGLLRWLPRAQGVGRCAHNVAELIQQLLVISLYLIITSYTIIGDCVRLLS